MSLLRQVFFGKRQSLPAKPLAPFSVDVEGRDVLVNLKRHATARRFVLRLARDASCFTLSMPKRQSLAAAHAFVISSQAWMRKALQKHAAPVPVADGATLMLRGKPLLLHSTGKSRGLTVYDQMSNTLFVPGNAQHLKRRTTEWFKQQAEMDLKRASSAYADQMQCRFTKLLVRDQKSRWGSCSSDGVLSFSWRLVLAPDYVLDYVAAHEVAHLKEMNHGPRFWRLVLKHCPHTRDAKNWLKQHGNSLHRVM